MPKKLIQRFMPKPETLREHKYLRMFGKLLHKPNLWVLNRKSAPGAFAAICGLDPDAISNGGRCRVCHFV
jgi:uncharacterized protein (DUF2062 family)